LPFTPGVEQGSVVGFRGAVEEFKRRLIETALRQAGWNRTHAARSLGLQRTYLLRLIRDLGVPVRPAGRPFQPGGPLTPARPPRPPAPTAPVNGPRPAEKR